jgi:hypothetical protein
LEEAAKLRRSGHCLDWFFLAVAQSQVGEKQQAQSCLSNAMRWMMTNSPGCPDYKRLQAEVEMATR